MAVNDGPEIERGLIARVRPDLARMPLEEVATGWDCRVVLAGDAVFRFPRDAGAARRLEREPALLVLAARHVPVPVPTLTLHRAQAARFGLFSEHRRLRGDMVDAAAYHGFDDATREQLAADLAATYAALHRIDLDDARAAGAGPVAAWASADAIFPALSAVLDPALLGAAARVLSVAATLPDEAAVFGHFDTHGWNMAFDLTAGRLAGLFDFGDAGIGPLHRDLSYPCFVSPDLAARTVRRYRSLTRHTVVLERVFTLHTVLRLVEVAAAREEERARFVWMLTDWLAALSRFRSGRPAQAGERHRRHRRDGSPSAGP